MAKRIIEIEVNDEYVLGSGVVIGAAGDDESMALRVSFNDTWLGLNIYATFRDAKGENPTAFLLLPSLLVPGEVRTYDVVVPAAATKHDGKMSVVFSGFAITESYLYAKDGDTVVKELVYRDAVINTTNAYFRVLPSDFSALDVEDQTEASTVEQMLAEMNRFHERLNEHETLVAERLDEQDEKIESFNVNIEGQETYSVKQADSSGDGITNTLLSEHSSAWGRGTTAGSKGFKIIGQNSANKTYTLSGSPETYAPGDVFSIKGFVTSLGGIYFYTNYGTITSVNGSVVTLNDYLALTLSEEEGEEAWFYVAEKPEDGDNDIGTGAHSEGKATKALGIASHAEGRSTQAIGFYSHAEGRGTIASFASHAEGVRSKAMGESSHAEGLEALAEGIQSHAEGCWTKAIGQASHAEGSSYNQNGSKLSKDAIAKGHASHVEGGGSQTTEAAYYGHAEGWLATSANIAAHAEGYFTNANGKFSHAEGYNTTTEADAESSHVEGSGTTAKKSCSHAEGFRTISEGIGAHAEGRETIAKGGFSHAEGSSYLNSTFVNAAKADGYASHVEGIGGMATATASHSEGYVTTTKGNYSHSEGYYTFAEATASHAEGVRSKAMGEAAHAEGIMTSAEGQASHAGGIGTKTTVAAQMAIGKYNAEESTAMFIVGNGTSDTDRKNLFSVGVDYDGVAYITLGGAKITLDSGEGY